MGKIRKVIHKGEKGIPKTPWKNQEKVHKEESLIELLRQEFSGLPKRNRALCAV
jgi:hypothetical protein